jgi:hypothetical protein
VEIPVTYATCPVANGQLRTCARKTGRSSDRSSEGINPTNITISQPTKLKILNAWLGLSTQKCPIGGIARGEAGGDHSNVRNSIPFTCPKCHEEIVIPATAGAKYDDLLPAPCINCGNLFTDNDVQSQSLKHAEKLLRDAFRKL